MRERETVIFTTDVTGWSASFLSTASRMGPGDAHVLSTASRMGPGDAQFLSTASVVKPDED